MPSPTPAPLRPAATLNPEAPRTPPQDLSLPSRDAALQDVAAETQAARNPA